MMFHVLLSCSSGTSLEKGDWIPKWLRILALEMRSLMREMLEKYLTHVHLHTPYSVKQQHVGLYTY